MKHNLSRLKNGLRVLTVPMPNLESATVTVWVKTGSRDETNKISGISHFLEHMAFKGGERYPSAKEVSEAVDSFGGEFNAATSKEWTKYYIRARTSSLKTAFDILGDMVLSPLLKLEDINREKGVIVQEIAMYEDTPVRRVWDIFEQLIFKGHDLGRDIIGTKEIVTSFNRNDFKRYREKHYVTDNMLISVAGGVTHKKILDFVEKYFEGVKKGKSKRSKRFEKSQKSPATRLYSKKKEQVHLVLGFLGNRFGHKDRYSDAVLNAILGGGMSSRLFTEIREKRGLAYAVKSGIDNFFDTGYFAVYAGVEPKKTEETIKVILEQLYGLANEGLSITQKELKKAKEYIKGHFALSLEDTSAIADFYGYEKLFLGRVRSVEEVFKGIDKVKVEDVYASAKKIFKKEAVNLALIGPYKEQARFEKLLR